MHDKPIFLLGVGRCGTTLVQRVLNTVDNVCIWGEHAGFLRKIGAGYHALRHGEKAREWIYEHDADKDSYAEVIKNPEAWQAWANWFGPEDVERMFARFVRDFFCPEALPAGTRWGFKEIRYGATRGIGDNDPSHAAVHMLEELFPQAKFVVAVREPVANIASERKAWNLGHNAATQATRWAMNNAFFQEQALCRSNQWAVVRLEDMIEPGSDTLETLFAWLGLEYGDEQRRVLALKQGRGGFDYNIDDLIAPDEQELIRRITAETAVRLGY